MDVRDIAAWNRLNYIANTQYGGRIPDARAGIARRGINTGQPMAERDSFGLEGIYDPETDQVIDNGWDTFQGTLLSIEPRPVYNNFSLLNILRNFFGW